MFTGGQAHDRRLCQALARRLNLPAQIGDPLAALSVSDALRQKGFTDARPELSVAIGLSLGGRGTVAGESRMSQLNPAPGNTTPDSDSAIAWISSVWFSSRW